MYYHRLYLSKERNWICFQPCDLLQHIPVLNDARPNKSEFIHARSVVTREFEAIVDKPEILPCECRDVVVANIGVLECGNEKVERVLTARLSERIVIDVLPDYEVLDTMPRDRK